MIEYAVERFIGLQDDLPPLFRRHYERVALNQDEIPLDPNWEGYRQLDTAGILRCVTVREDKKLIGYYIFMVLPSLHYHSTVMAYVDIYFILPRRNPLRLLGLYRGLFRAAEAEMRRSGVRKSYTMVKLHSPVLGILWKRMGYTAVETIFSKLIG